MSCENGQIGTDRAETSEHGLDGHVDQRVFVSPGEAGLDDEEGGKTVQPGPDHLANEIRGAVDKFAGFHAQSDTAAKLVEGFHRLGELLQNFIRSETLSGIEEECNGVLVGMPETEFHVGAAALQQRFQRVGGGANDVEKNARQLGESLFANAFKESGFVLEMQVNGGGRIFYFLRKPPHGKLLIALIGKNLQGRTQDLLAEIPTLSCFALRNTQVTESNTLSPFQSSRRDRAGGRHQNEMPRESSPKRQNPRVPVRGTS
jgi:hypothetical protein